MANEVRVSRADVDVARQMDAPAVRVSRADIDVARQLDAPTVRVSRADVDVARQQDGFELRVTTLKMTVVRLAPPGERFGRLTQIYVEAAQDQPPTLGYLTQTYIELARNFALQPIPVLKSWMVFDPEGSLDVRMLAGFPTSAASEEEVLNGANVIAMGLEIFQFKDATDLGDNVYRLSHLLRGRLGTEQHMNSHAANEMVVLLEPSTIRKTYDDISELNNIKFWKAIGIGQSVYGTSASTAINTGISLKPWAPVNIVGVRDGGNDLTISWNRRSRIGYEWNNYIDVPIGESVYEFKVEILDASGANVRTIQVFSAESAIYTSAQQTTDFGGPQALVLVRVSQLSESFGFGYTNSEII